ncbi:Zinc finger, CCCH-type [Parasponia andersonii]|uniref:Zinc finger, CCCH-type n=1 Tax=Parasponia andersonii TaxID=3476 RepID=A0A2P5BR63_PARAD|nr:Zinc finger, CCCH-type [Parasponia andersonii]
MRASCIATPNCPAPQEFLWSGSIICPYYLKTGACKYGPTCKFDHPPPGEVMGMGNTQESSSIGEAAKGEEENGGESIQ